ncbi:MAG: sigma-70 family RNA polymerase sigma factor [Pirellulaceae bacterium]
MATVASLVDDREEVCSLVLAAQDGDRAALGELFDRFQGHVLAIATRRLGDAHEAQELCQEVFLQVMQKIGQLRDPACFAGWLRQITHRMAINRGMRRGPAVCAELQTMESTCVDQVTPDSVLEANERASHVHFGLSRLGRMDRETLVAFYVHGQSLIEMSDEFQAPVGTIKRRLCIARRRLAKEVEHLVTA